MLTLNIFIFLSAEQVARYLLLGDILIFRMQSSCTFMGFVFFWVMCYPKQEMHPSLLAKAILSKESLIVILLTLQSDSKVVLCQFPSKRSHFVIPPLSSPKTMDPLLGQWAAQLMGLLFLYYLTTFLTFRSNILTPPSSQAVQMILSSFLRQPTALTLPLKLPSIDLMGLLGLARSIILTALYMPAIILSFFYEIWSEIGAESNLMVSLGLWLLVEGSQNRMVLSYDPLASFKLIDLFLIQDLVKIY